MEIRLTDEDAALGVDQQLLRNLIKRLQSDSERERDAVRQMSYQLHECQLGNQEQQALAWYFLNFAQGYGYLIRQGHSFSARHGRLLPQQVASHLGVGARAPNYLAIRPASFTSWALLDVDEGSRYHPGSLDGEGLEPIFEALRAIGLNQAIELQSSTSTGMHLLFPLNSVVSSWDLALSLEQCLLEAGLQLKAGVLELRPNVKTWGSNYQAIRAPLTGEGNAFWAPDFCDFGLHDDLVLFQQLCCASREKNDFHALEILQRSVASCSPNRRRPAHKMGALRRAQERLAEGFSASGQTNELTFLAQQVARLVEGINTEEGLRRRCSELISQAPGFSEFCSHQREVLDGCYWTDKTLRQCLAMSPGGYEGTHYQRCNQRRSDEASQRALRAIQLSLESGLRFPSLNAAIGHLKTQGGPSASWWKNPKNKIIKEELMEQLVARED